MARTPSRASRVMIARGRSNTSVPRPASSVKIGKCTHITMTRIYNPQALCALCFRPGPFGWLYRCTQDREIIVEKDLEADEYQQYDLDQLYSNQLLIRSTGNGDLKLKSSSNVGFLDRLNDAGVQVHTVEQINTSSRRYNELFNSIDEPELSAEIGGGLQIFMPSGSDYLSPITPVQVNPKEMSWVPAKECQFACCHHCRPSCADRSWISLDAVVNDDLPLTAVVGFGFHEHDKRPVALAKLVRNIGLQENPNPSRNSELFTVVRKMTSRIYSASQLAQSIFISDADDATSLQRVHMISTKENPYNESQTFAATFLTDSTNSGNPGNLS